MRLRVALVIGVFVALYTTVSVSSYVQKSATWDEPQHLAAGYAALRLGDHRLSAEHPPLLRMWAALPLLASGGVMLDTNISSWAAAEQFEFAHQFLYRQNNADSLLYRARFMIVLLGVLLGLLVFCWAGELFGFWPAVFALWLYCLEPNLLAHAQLVTTDLGFSCFFFGTIYFLWRTIRRLAPGNLAGLGLFFALAQISKFSALLLVPIVLVLLALRACQATPWRWRFGRREGSMAGWRAGLATVGIMLLLGAAAGTAIWAAYGFRYAPVPSAGHEVRLRPTPSVIEQSPRVAQVMGWIDHHRFLPNAYTQGFLLGQVQAQQRTAFLAGRFSLDGWWHYFPTAFAVKTPITLLLPWGLGLIGCTIRRSRRPRDDVFLWVPFAAFLGVAMTSHLNIGVRHILPVYPFAILLAGKTFATWRLRLRCSLLVALVILPFVEVGLVYPHFLAFFNGFCGGPRQGHKILIDSNLDWGQDLKPLKRWMKAHQVQHINLAYFGTADPGYYGIHATDIGSLSYRFPQTTERPRLPGYVAVSVHLLQTGFTNGYLTEFFQPLLKRQPVAVIGYSIHVYWVDHPWWREPTFDFSPPAD